jgi:hypothetical protein
MTRKKARRSRLGMTWFALALGALALLAMPGLAAAKDRNHDRIPDRWEKRHRLSTKVNQARRDQDRDHLRNRAEFLAGDNPRDRDSDDDGVVDGDEQAGTIQSFDAETGRLVIDLFGEDTIAGFVTDGTEIKCEDEGGASASSEGSDGVESGDDQVGDDDGAHEEEPGDDHGDDGEEVGDEEEHGDSGPGDNSGPGENSGPGAGEESDEGGDRLCTTAALVPGAVVEEAELEIRNGRAVFEEIELSGREV